MHVMREQAQFLRRLVICRDGYEPAAESLVEEHGLGFCRPGVNDNGDDYYSWWNPWTARYFPQNVVLPDLSYLGIHSMRTRDRDRLNAYYGQVRDGVSGPEPIPTGNLGWAHPYGVAYGGMHGGTEIWQYDGVTTAFSRVARRLPPVAAHAPACTRIVSRRASTTRTASRHSMTSGS